MIHDTSAPAPTVRERRRLDTIERIAEGALRIVTEEGLEALTIQRLAADLGYTAGALYRYFPSKDAILLAAQRRVLDLVRSDLRDALAAVDAKRGDPSDSHEVDRALLRLVALLDAYASLRERRPRASRLLAISLGDPRELVDTADARELVPDFMSVLHEVTRALDEAASVGAIDRGDALERAAILWASLQGSVGLAKLARFGVPQLEAAALTRASLRALLCGFGANPARVEIAQRASADVAASLPRDAEGGET